MGGDLPLWYFDLSLNMDMRFGFTLVSGLILDIDIDFGMEF